MNTVERLIVELDFWLACVQFPRPRMGLEVVASCLLSYDRIFDRDHVTISRRTFTWNKLPFVHSQLELDGHSQLLPLWRHNVKKMGKFKIGASTWRFKQQVEKQHFENRNDKFCQLNFWNNRKITKKLVCNWFKIYLPFRLLRINLSMQWVIDLAQISGYTYRKRSRDENMQIQLSFVARK